MITAGPAAPAAAILFSEFKYWATGTLGLSRDALHIHIGLALYLSLLLLARGRMKRIIAWLLVLVLTIAGEVPDYLVLRQDAHIFDAWRHLHDVFNTMVWPSVLAVLGTLNVAWRDRQGRRRGEDARRRSVAADAKEGSQSCLASRQRDALRPSAASVSRRGANCS